jgi:hypothetical protein
VSRVRFEVCHRYCRIGNLGNLVSDHIQCKLQELGDVQRGEKSLKASDKRLLVLPVV